MAEQTPATSAAAQHAETTPTQTPTETKPEEKPTTSAAAQHAEEQSKPTETKPEEKPTTSAAAQHAEEQSKPTETKPTETKPEEKPAEPDLAKMSDEDWAKAVMPDPDPEDKDAPKPDRTLLDPMAKELREAGVQPSVMQKVVAAYQKSVDKLVKERAEQRTARMAELTEACNREVTADEWKDFAAAYNAHIAGDKELKDLFDHTELGSNPKLVKLIALAGATIRGDRPPPATATAGSSQTDTDRAVFLRTTRPDQR